jgi:hypothetical protein
MNQFEMVGTGFDPGEPVTIRLTPMPTGAQAASPYPVVVSHVDATDPDGSFDQMVAARVAGYTVTLTGDISHKTVDITQDPTINLAIPTDDPAASVSKATFC